MEPTTSAILKEFREAKFRLIKRASSISREIDVIRALLNGSEPNRLPPSNPASRGNARLVRRNASASKRAAQSSPRPARKKRPHPEEGEASPPNAPPDANGSTASPPVDEDAATKESPVVVKETPASPIPAFTETWNGKRLLQVACKLIREHSGEAEVLPSFKSAGIPRITKDQLKDAYGLIPSAEDVSPEVANAMFWDLGRSVVEDPEIRAFLLSARTPRTIGDLLSILPKTRGLKPRAQLLLLAGLANALNLPEICSLPSLAVL